MTTLVSATIDWDTDPNTFIPLYDMEETSGLTDISGNGNNGTANGGVTFNALNTSFSFDGTDDYVNADTIFDTSAQTGVTISAWMTYDTTTSFSGVRIGTKNSGYLMIQTVGSTLYGGMSDPDETAYRFATSDSGITTGQIYHVLATIENGNVTLWVNGTQQSGSSSAGSSTFSAITGASADNLYIGASGQSTTNDNIDDFMRGNISDVIIFPRLLTFTEITDLYAEGVNYNPYSVASSCTPTSNTVLSADATCSEPYTVDAIEIYTSGNHITAQNVTTLNGGKLICEGGSKCIAT